MCYQIYIVDDELQSLIVLCFIYNVHVQCMQPINLLYTEPVKEPLVLLLPVILFQHMRMK